MTETKNGVDYGEMQIADAKRMISKMINPNGYEKEAISDQKAYEWAKEELLIPDTYSYERFEDNGRSRVRIFRTRLADTFYVEDATKTEDGPYQISARLLRRLGSRTLALNANDILTIGVPIF